MARGKLEANGTTRVAKNGYHYTKVEERGWVLTHWLTIEATLGRRIEPERESVRFANGYNKENYDNPKAIVVVPKKSSSLRKRRATLEERVREMQAEIEQINRQLEES